MDQQVTIEGTVSKFLLMNPHTWIEVVAPDQARVPQTWSVEWNAAGILGSRGVNRDTLKPGDEVTITMSPGKSQAEHRGLLRIIRRPADGFEWGTKPGEVPVDWLGVEQK